LPGGVTTNKRERDTFMAQLTLALGASRIIQAPAAIIGAVSSRGLVKLQTSAAHGLLTNDIVQIEGVIGTVESNIQAVITKVDATHFTLNNSTFLNAYVSGGSAVHVGWATPAVLVDNTVFATVPDFTLCTRSESLSPGSNVRVVWSDAVDSGFVTEQPLYVCEKGAGDSLLGGEVTLPSCKRADAPDASRSFGASGGYLRTKVFLSGGPFSSAQLSAWVTY
jgi:hypothetical protein